MTDEQQPIAPPPTPFVPLNLPDQPSQAGESSSASTIDGTAIGDATNVMAPVVGSPAPTDPNAAQSGATDAEPDPLLDRPRTSSRVLCIVLGLLLIAAAFGVWWLGVRTETGQSYDEIVVTGFADALPAWLAATLSPFIDWNVGTVILNLTVLLSLLFGVIAVAVTIVRKRWLLLVQSVVIVALCYASTFLKELLPRPYLIDTQTPHANSAPSGHTILAAAASMLLLIAVPRVWRAVCAVISAGFTAVIGFSVIAGGWHRPADAVMSVLLVGGWTLIVLAFTAKTGMDQPGSRVSSASVQIVGTVMITAGLLGIAYTAYVIWQVLSGLALSAAWSASGAYLSTIVGVTGVTLLTVGLVLAMRQLTAAPLSRLGLIGAPPAPPKQ